MRHVEDYIIRHQGKTFIILVLISVVVYLITGVKEIHLLTPMLMLLPHFVFVGSVLFSFKKLARVEIPPEGKSLKQISREAGLRPKKVYLILEMACKSAELTYKYKTKSGLYKWRSDVPDNEHYHRLYFTRSEGKGKRV